MVFGKKNEVIVGVLDEAERRLGPGGFHWMKGSMGNSLGDVCLLGAIDVQPISRRQKRLAVRVLARALNEDGMTLRWACRSRGLGGWFMVFCMLVFPPKFRREGVIATFNDRRATTFSEILGVLQRGRELLSPSGMDLGEQQEEYEAPAPVEEPIGVPDEDAEPVREPEREKVPA